MTKQELLKKIEIEIDKMDSKEYGNLLARYDRKWRYPRIGDSQGTCPLLDVMFDIEYRSGTIIFIPDLDNKFGQPGNTQRNQEEG